MNVKVSISKYQTRAPDTLAGRLMSKITSLRACGQLQLSSQAQNVFAVNKDNEGNDDDNERKEGRKMEDFNCAFKVISLVEDRAS